MVAWSNPPRRWRPASRRPRPAPPRWPRRARTCARPGRPRARAASWLAAVARMASPSREWRRNSQSRATTVAVTASLARSEWNTTTPATSVRSSPHGWPTWRSSSPMRSPATTWRTMKTPTVTMVAENTGSPTMGRSGDALDRRPDQGGHQHRHGQGGPEAEPDDQGEVRGPVGAEDHQGRLGEVHHPGAAVDDHEPEAQQGVERPRARPRTVEARNSSLSHPLDPPGDHPAGTCPR